MIYEIAKFFKNKYTDIKNYFGYKEQFETLKSFVDVKNLLPASGNLRRVQMKNLDFTKEIVAELEDNNINPFMLYGTLLGAERHKGYIPWDDDVDFGLIRSDYDAVLEYYKKNYHVEFQSVNHYRPQSSAKKRIKELLNEYQNEKILLIYPTLLKIIKGTNLNDYIQMDLFPFDYYSENYKYNDFVKELNIITDKLWLINNTKKEYEFLKSKIGNNKNIVKNSNKIFYGYDNADAQKSGSLKKYNNFMNTSDIFPLKRMQFEDTEFWAPNNHIKILEDYFGRNWCEIPDNIIPPHLNEREE